MCLNSVGDWSPTQWNGLVIDGRDTVPWCNIQLHTNGQITSWLLFWRERSKKKTAANWIYIITFFKSFYFTQFNSILVHMPKGVTKSLQNFKSFRITEFFFRTWLPNLWDGNFSFTKVDVSRSNAGLLEVPSKSRKKIGDAAFVNYAPVQWNILPIDIREASSLNIFKRKLKTYFFTLAFN